MSLNRRRPHAEDAGIDTSNLGSYTGTSGIRRIDAPTQRESVRDICNLDSDDDGGLVLRKPLVLKRDLPSGITGTFLITLYSFDGLDDHDIIVTSTGFWSVTGANIPVTETDKFGIKHTLTAIESSKAESAVVVHDYRISADVTAVPFNTAVIVSGVKLCTKTASSVPHYEWRFIRYSSNADNSPNLEMLVPTESHINKYTEGSNILAFNPNLYNDVYQDIRDDYESPSMDVLGILSYALYNSTTKKLERTTAVNPLTVETLLRSTDAIHYTLCSMVPEGTSLYLKAFVSIKKYPRAKIYCAWEQTLDGVNYNVCPEFSLKFASRLITLKIQKDTTGTPEFKNVSVMPFDIVSDNDNVNNRPDVLNIRADNYQRRFVLYTLPTFEVVDGVEGTSSLVSAYPSTPTTPTTEGGYSVLALWSYNNYKDSIADSRYKSGVSRVINGTVNLADNYKLWTSFYAPFLTEADNIPIQDFKKTLSKQSVLKNNVTTKFNLLNQGFSVSATVKYFENGSVTATTETLKDATTGLYHSHDPLATFVCARPSVPHCIIVKGIVIRAAIPDAFYPWTLKCTTTRTNGVPILATEDADCGDYTGLDLTKKYPADSEIHAYSHTVSITKKQATNLGLNNSFTLTNINKINHNSINCAVELDSFSITNTNTYAYELQLKPAIAKDFNSATDLFVGGPLQQLDADYTGNIGPVYVKEGYSLLNKDHLVTFSVPKTEVPITENLSSAAYLRVPNVDAYLASRLPGYTYGEWLTQLFSKDSFVLTEPFNGHWVNTTTPPADPIMELQYYPLSSYTARYEVLSKKTPDAQSFLFEIPFTVVTGSEDTFNTSAVIVEQPALHMYFDCCYGIETETTNTYDAADIVDTVPTAETNYYFAGNHLKILIPSSGAAQGVFNATHVCNINLEDMAPISEATSLAFTCVLSSNVEINDAGLGNPAEGIGLLNYKKSIYAYGANTLKTNILVSTADSYDFPLGNILDLDAMQDSVVHALIAWRDYLVAATDFAVYLISKQAGALQFTNKVVNTFTGVSKADSKTMCSILNGIMFKNNTKVFSMVPNPSSSVDSILTLGELSRPLENLIPTTSYNNLGFTTERYYGLFVVTKSIKHGDSTNLTELFKYYYSTKVWVRMEYPIAIKQIYINALQEILLTDYDGKEYYLNKDVDSYFETIQYGDILSTSYMTLINPDTDIFEIPITPITFMIDSGEKAEDMVTVKHFLETNLTFAVKSAKNNIDVTINTYVDGHVHVNCQSIASDSPFWLDVIPTKGVLNTTFSSNDSNVIHTVKHLILRHNGNGRTIRHIITGSSLMKFKFYVAYYKYRNLPGQR